MEPDTERLERNYMRSPKQRLNINSGDEGDLDSTAKHSVAELAITSEETLQTALLCEKNVMTSDTTDRVLLTDKPILDATSEILNDDAMLEKENIPSTTVILHETVADSIINGISSSFENDRQLLKDLQFDSAKASDHESGIFENEIQNNDALSVMSELQQSHIPVTDIHEIDKREIGDFNENDIPDLLPKSLNSSVKIPTESGDSAIDSGFPSADQINSVKEPEEPNHKADCELLHDSATAHEDKKEKKVEGMMEGEDNDGWLYVLGHDKLKKRVIQKGLENSRPISGQIVTVKCVGHLEDGTEVDKYENLTITLGDCDLIHALDLCVALMDKGEVCEVLTDSRFAYGEIGRDPDVPPNAVISYVIELLDYRYAPDYSTMTIADRVKLSNEKRERGNHLYSRNEFSHSIDLYTKALKALDEEFESHGESAEDLQQLIDTRIKCHNNMAAAQMKIGAWDAAAKSCDAVLKVQPDNVKALFRKGKCFSNKGDVSEALPLLKRALKLEPETKIIHQELSRLEKKNKAQAETEKVLYQKMLGTDKFPPTDKENKKKKEGSSSKWLWYVAGGAAAVLVSLGLTAYRYIHI